MSGVKIGDAVYNILSNDADVLAAVGSTGIHQGVVDDNTTLPCIVWTVISMEPTEHKDAASAKDIARVQVSNYTRSPRPYEAWELADHVRDALDRITPAAYAGVSVVESRFEDAGHFFNDESKIHQIDQDFIITFKR